MLMPTTSSIRRLLAATALGALALATPALAEMDELTIIAPANPGGGWDQTARVMQTVLQEQGLVDNVQVKNVPGAGGTIGLAQFVTSEAGSGDTILGAGLALQGSGVIDDTVDVEAQVDALLDESFTDDLGAGG